MPRAPVDAMASGRLTIGILAGRESEWLEACLSGLPEFDGPRLVVTNFDQPEPRAVCERFGARCELFAPPGPFSFSRQRNRLLDLCPTPWLLMIDVDEMISAEDLSAAIAISREAAVRSRVVRHVYLGRDGVEAIDHQARLVPIGQGQRFEGSVAETLEAEHRAPETLELSNLTIVDRGAIWQPDRMQYRRQRFAELSRHEMVRLAALARSQAPQEWGRLAFRYWLLGRWRAAAHFARRAAQHEPQRWCAEYVLARIEAAELGETDSALRRLWELVDRRVPDYRIYFELTRLHAGREESMLELRAAQRGADCLPRCSAMHEHLARAHEKLGHRELAQAARGTAASLLPRRPAIAGFRSTTTFSFAGARS